MSRVDEVAWAHYRLPFRAGLASGAVPLVAREGVLLRLRTSDGVEGLGDAAPIEERGEGRPADVVALLADLAPRLRWAALSDLPERTAGLMAAPGGAALACGLETAALDAEGRASGRQVAALLGPHPRASVGLNATIAEAGTDAAARAAREAVGRGFTTLKLKAGLLADPDAEATRLRAIRAAAGPAARLRIDANGVWSADQAIRTVQALAPCDLEWVEQPVAADDLAGLRAVRRETGVAVAVDEGLRPPAGIEALLAAEAADVLVLKPGSLGGPRRTAALAMHAVDAGLRVVVTSSMESGVGVAGALHVAASLTPEPPACGLATAALLSRDLLASPLEPAAGRMALPSGVGLGVSLGTEAVAGWAVVWPRPDGLGRGSARS